MFMLTKEEIADTQLKSLNALAAIAGNMSHLARMLDVPYPTVQAWFRRGRISYDGALLVLRHPKFNTIFTLETMRPDLIKD